jgi:ABC-type Fe3+/spermidine/putrescine transport system ATPase subunit
MLRLESVGKRFGEVVAVDGLSLDVAEGELLSLLGPSGCGKTTTLRMVAGFETPSAGRIAIAGRDVTALPPQKRGIGMVFQNYALFPHLSVRENVAFGLESTRVPRADVERRVVEVLRRVDLEGYGARRVQQLSGGQQQRVALARALAPEPPLLLLDEPLSNLDASLRERTRDELRSLLKQVGMTAIFVTHDQEEAFALSDRIALLDRGRLEQVGTPESLYVDPASPFVAGFVGKANLVDAKLVEGGGERGVCELAGRARWPARLRAGAAGPDGRVRLMVRPESLRLEETDGAGEGEDGAGAALRVRVVERRFAGAFTHVRVAAADGAEFVVAVPPGAPLAPEAWLRPAPGALPIAFPPAA